MFFRRHFWHATPFVLHVLFGAVRPLTFGWGRTVTVGNFSHVPSGCGGIVACQWGNRKGRWGVHTWSLFLEAPEGRGNSPFAQS